MPRPGKDETQEEFISRCIPIVMDEGTAEDNKQAAAICYGIWRDDKKEKMSTFLIDDYVSTKAGEPFRLFPFGKLVKNGKVREITRALAEKFRLPGFKPPIKLGSHDDPTPAGGHLLGLQVREDGLYGVPEYTEKGWKAIQEGDYRYQSPEVIWEGGSIEDANTGEPIPGPLILGVALTHTPHLGEAAALYSIEPMEVISMENTVQVPTNVWQDMWAWFKGTRDAKPDPDPVPNPEPDQKADELAAVMQEREDFKSQYETLKAEIETQKSRAELLTQLQDKEKFGMTFIELKDADEAVKQLAGMSEEQRNWVLTKFSAFIARIDTGKLFDEKGKDEEGLPEQPKEALNARVKQVMEEQKVDYAKAIQHLAENEPELVRAAYPAK